MSAECLNLLLLLSLRLSPTDIQISTQDPSVPKHLSQPLLVAQPSRALTPCSQHIHEGQGVTSRTGYPRRDLPCGLLGVACGWPVTIHNLPNSNTLVPSFDLFFQCMTVLLSLLSFCCLTICRFTFYVPLMCSTFVSYVLLM